MRELYYKYKEDLQREGVDGDALRLVEKAYNKNTLHPVVEALINVATSPNPTFHPLRRQLGVGIEAGGLAGAVSCYGAAALEFIGWKLFKTDIVDCFNVVAGTSAGAPNAAYWKQGRAFYGRRAYHELFNKHPFLNIPFQSNFPWISLITLNDLRRMPVVNVGHLIQSIRDDQLGDPKPDGSQLVFIASLVNRELPGDVNQRKFYLTNFKNEEELIKGIEASVTIPFLSGLKLPTYQGQTVTDGSLVEHLPAKSLLEEFGCSKIIVLGCTQDNKPAKKLSLGEQIIARFYMGRIDPGLSNLWLNRAKQINQTRAWLREETQNPRRDYQICFISPEVNTPAIGMFETNGDKIKAAGIGSVRSVFAAFGILDRDVQNRLIARMCVYDSEPLL